MFSSLNPAPAPLGHVVAIGGSSASVRLDDNPALAGEAMRITIGTFLGIETDTSSVVAVITNVDGTAKAAGAEARGLLARADLLGFQPRDR